MKNFVNVDTRFQKSINLTLDTGDMALVNRYIPTRSSVSILKQYLTNIVRGQGEHATILIGPYGKGKSHHHPLILSLENTLPEDFILKPLAASLLPPFSSTPMLMMPFATSSRNLMAALYRFRKVFSRSLSSIPVLDTRLYTDMPWCIGRVFSDLFQDTSVQTLQRTLSGLLRHTEGTF